MMKIKVNFSYRLKELAGTKELEVEMKEGSKAKDLLQKLTNKFGEKFKKDVWSEENKTYVSIAINNKISNIEAELSPNDEVYLSLPVPSG